MDRPVSWQIRSTPWVRAFKVGSVLAILIVTSLVVAQKQKEAEPESKLPDPHFLRGDDARRAADLGKTMAFALKADRWEEAIAAGEELLALRSRVQGPKHFETVNDRWRLTALRRVAPMPREDRVAYLSATTITERADRLYAQGKHDLAQPLYEQALEIRHRLLTDDHPEAAGSYDRLGMNLHAQPGKFALALPILNKALEIRCRILTDDHPDTAESYDNVAYMLDIQGKYALAQPLHEKALEIDRRHLTDDDARTALVYNNVGSNLKSQGKYALAQPFLEKALDITRRILTDDHSDTATNYKNLANNLNAQGMYALAQPLHEKALEIRRRLLTDDHLLTTKSYNDLALNLSAQGKHAKAYPLFKKALEINCLILTEDHQRTALAYNNLGENLGAQGAHVEAQRHLEAALEIRRRILTDDHPDTADSYHNLATNLDAQGPYTRAQPLHERSVEIYRRLLSDDHPGTIRGYNGLAKNLNAQGKYREARDQWEHSAKGLDTARLRVAFAGLARAGSMHSPRAEVAAVLARLGEPERAWQTLEKDLGRGLLDELAARQNDRFAPDERDRVRDLKTALGQLDQLVETSPEGPRPADWAKQLEGLKHQRTQASIALGELQAKLARVHGDVEGRVATLHEIQAVLPPDAALIAWVDIPHLGPNAADPDGDHWGVAIRARGVPAWVPIDGTDPEGRWSEDDTALAERVRAELRTCSDVGRAAPTRLLDRLRAQRLAPLDEALATADGLPTAERLIVLPSHAMAGIPVEALLATDDTRTVSYAPSASVFKYLRERPRPDRHAGLLALGDPTYRRRETPSDPEPPDHGLLVNVVTPGSNAATRGLRAGDVLLSYNGSALHKQEDLKTVVEPGQPVPVEFWRGGKIDRLKLSPGELGVVFATLSVPLAIIDERNLRQLLVATRSGSEVFPPLRWSRDEVEAMAKLFSDDDRPAHILLATRASESELERLAASGELGRFGVIHLAAHAEIDEVIPARSAVILTQIGLPDPLEQAMKNKPVFDGRLSVREIQRGWELKAELVTLSACETGRGRDAGGEGFVGFTQALLMSGARSVCVSLWKVDDRATSLLMTRFYQNWLGRRPGLDKPLSKAESLREAKQWLRSWNDQEVNSVARGDIQAKASKPTLAQPYAHPHFWAGFILVGDPD